MSGSEQAGGPGLDDEGRLAAPDAGTFPPPGPDGGTFPPSPGPDAEPHARPALSISEAARACRVDRRTVRRRLDAGELPGAYRDADGHWRIPVDALLAAGLRPFAPSPPDLELERQAVEPEPSDVERLRAELADERARRMVAEAVAAERERVIEAQALALRALAPGGAPERAQEAPTSAPPVPPAPVTPAEPERAPTAVPEPRRRWWSRRP